MRIRSSIANLHEQASSDSQTTTQALYGEGIRVLGEPVNSNRSHWLEIELQNDQYTGFIEADHLYAATNERTHRVTTKATPLFLRADIKSPVTLMLSLGSELCLQDCDNPQFLKSDTEHYVWKQHVGNLSHKLDMPLLNVARQFFTGAPYVWGGRSSSGLDCSALVQLSAMLTGHALPRDTQDQIAYFETNSVALKSHGLKPATPIDYEHRQANDLMYWPGHVAIVQNQNSVFHATAHSLSCCEEPLSAVESRAGIAHSIWRL